MGYSRERSIARPRVLLDTNILMLLAERVDVFSEIEELLETKPEYYVLRQVIGELERIAREGSFRERKAAQLALRVIEKKCRVLDIDRPSGWSVDDLILYVAVKEGFIVATSDKELRRRLREKGVPDIYFRWEKRRLETQYQYI